MQRRTQKLKNPVAITTVRDLSEDHVRYFQENPEKLDLISDRKDFAISKYIGLLIAAILLVGLSKYIAEAYSDTFSQFINNVVVDLIFEMGAALIGSVATVMFIQIQDKRQFERNLRLRLEIERRIDERKRATGA